MCKSRSGKKLDAKILNNSNLFRIRSRKLRASLGKGGRAEGQGLIHICFIISKIQEIFHRTWNKEIVVRHCLIELRGKYINIYIYSIHIHIFWDDMYDVHTHSWVVDFHSWKIKQNQIEFTIFRFIIKSVGKG